MSPRPPAPPVPAAALVTSRPRGNPEADPAVVARGLAQLHRVLGH